MTPYKSFLSATKAFFDSNAFLKFLLSAYIFIFAAGGLFFLLGLFIMQVYESFVCLGSILIWAGLLLSIIKEDVLTIVISSGTIALGGLVAWIIGLVGRSYFYGGMFLFTPFFYFLAFGAIALVVFLKAAKFKQMRTASAPQASLYPCPRCGGFVARSAAFCPHCGAKKPEPQPYAPPAQPYAAPAQPYPSSPVPPSASVASAAPVPPAPPAAPVQTAPPAPPAEPAAPVAEPAAGPKCAACGADLPEGAVFCGKCGAKQ